MTNRSTLIQALDAREPWDVIIIGGGATGLGCAVDASVRGYRTLLVERGDFAQGTSSRSTKLVHGGVRYLQQGNVRLVREALRERGRLLHNAPHLVWTRAFVVPAYAWWERSFYGLGLKAYDWLARGDAVGGSQWLPRDEVLTHIPTLRREGLRGGIMYHDGQFDDALLALCLARTAIERGACVLNYVRATGSLRHGDKLTGLVVRDVETGREYEVLGRAIICAVGIFTDEIAHWDDPQAPARVAFSQGAHIVLDRSFLPGDAAVLVPRTRDGRVLFAIPWCHRVLVGTTDTPMPAAEIEPRPLSAELEYLLGYTGQYLSRTPEAGDVLSAFAGIRPLAARPATGRTSALPRDHVIQVAPSGLIVIFGGKWTTYRQMAEEAIDKAIEVAELDHRPCATHDLMLHGAAEAGPHPEPGDWHRRCYGTDSRLLELLAKENSDWNRQIHPRLPYRGVDVVWAVRYGLARTLEDVLARRTRALLLDARASREAAPEVALLIAKELGRDAVWCQTQIESFQKLADGYVP